MKSSAPDKWQIFGGYTLQRDYGMPNAFAENASCYDTPPYCDEFAPFNSNGGQAAVSYFLTHHFGITFQMTFAGSGTRNVYVGDGDPTESAGSQSYLAGPVYRYAMKHGGITLFYHTLLGVTHNSYNFSDLDYTFCYTETSPYEHLSCSSNNFTLSTGGGVDIRVRRHIAVRPAQLEYWTEQVQQQTFDYFGPGQSAKFGVDGLRYSTGAVFNF